MSGPRVFKHGVYSALVIGEEDGGLITYGGLPVSGGTKVVLHRDASEGSQSYTAGVWTPVTGFTLDDGDAGMANADGQTIDIKEDGYYVIHGNIGFTLTAQAPELRILKNGVSTVARYSCPLSDNGTISQCGNEVYLQSGDSLEFQVYTSISGPHSYYSTNTGVGYFTAFKVSS